MHTPIVTHAQIAREAGCHPSTVSLALRAHPSIPETTRERITRISATLGYRADAVQGALSVRRHAGAKRLPRPVLGWLVDENNADGPAARAWRGGLLRGARAQAAALGFSIAVLAVDQRRRGMRALGRELERRCIRGVVLAAWGPGGGVVDLDWERLAAVRIDGAGRAPAVLEVGYDRIYGVRLAFQRLRELGYGRIGLVVSAADEATTDGSHALGWEVEQAAIDPNERVPLWVRADRGGADARHASLRGWVRRQRLDVVLATTADIVAELAGAGLRVPHDVACAVLCRSQRGRGPAGVAVDGAILGAETVVQLSALLDVGDTGVPEFPMQTRLRGFWCEGGSAPRVGPGKPHGPAIPEAAEVDRPRRPAPAVAGRGREPVSLRDIATALGLSTTAVSLALRDHPRLPPATRERVRATARDLGYRPDPGIRAFNTRRLAQRTGSTAETLAFIIDAHGDFLRRGHPYRELWMRGLRHAARRRGMKVDVLVARPTDSQARLERILRSRGVRGVVVYISSRGIRDLPVDWSRYAAVRIESGQLEPRLDTVSSDQIEAMRTACACLWARGYRRIGLATWVEDNARLEQRYLAGYLSVVRSLPADRRVEPLLFTAIESDEVGREVAAWYARERPDVVLSNWNSIPLLLERAGVRVPRDVAFASLDLEPAREQFSGMVQNHFLVGYQAAARVLQLLQTHRHGTPALAAGLRVASFWRDGSTAPTCSDVLIR